MGGGGGHAYPVLGEEARRFASDESRRHSVHQFLGDDPRRQSSQYSYGPEPPRPLAITAPPVQYPSQPPRPSQYQLGPETGLHGHPREVPREVREAEDRYAAYSSAVVPPGGNPWCPPLPPGNGPQV